MKWQRTIKIECLGFDPLVSVWPNPWDYIRTKIEITRKKRNPGRISKNGFLHSIVEGLEKTNTVGA